MAPQPMIPGSKYPPYKPLDLPNRKWPSKVPTSSPIWTSVDLRDGNQALINPMSSDQKLTFFKKLVQVGFQEIEVAFPSASETDFGFVRHIIENAMIPDGVWIQVLTPARSVERERENGEGWWDGWMEGEMASSVGFRLNVSE